MQKSLIISIVVSVVIVASLGLLFLDDNDNSIPELVNIGLLFPISGDFSTHGNENALAAKMAINDFNQYLKNHKASWQLVGSNVNTETSPETALDLVKEFHRDGIDIIIGPETSSELAMIKPYSDKNGLLVFSPSSTAPSLAKIDNIFRLAPTDTHQGHLIATLLEEQNIQAIVMLTRDDTWGNGLSQSITNSFLIDGIHPPKIEVKYSPENPNYFDVTNNLSLGLASHLENYTKDEIAVIVIGFGETRDFFKEATKYDNLSTVQWIGSDSNANEKKITEDTKALQFAKNVNFIALQFASDSNPIHEALEQRFNDKLGYDPSIYAYSTYDTIWIVGKSIMEADSIKPHLVKLEINKVAAAHNGALSSDELNADGDLKSANYDVWGIVDGAWKVIGNMAESNTK